MKKKTNKQRLRIPQTKTRRTFKRFWILLIHYNYIMKGTLFSYSIVLFHFSVTGYEHAQYPRLLAVKGLRPPFDEKSFVPWKQINKQITKPQSWC